MCIAIPRKVLKVDGFVAWVENIEGEERVDISLVGNVNVGDFLLTFKGAALRVVSQEEALKILSALDCLDKVMGGVNDSETINLGFRDLVNGEARLPDHLKSLVGKKIL